MRPSQVSHLGLSGRQARPLGRVEKEVDDGEIFVDQFEVGQHVTAALSRALPAFIFSLTLINRRPYITYISSCRQSELPRYQILEVDRPFLQRKGRAVSTGW